MAIVAVIAGAYTGTFGGAALNYTRSGFNLNFTSKRKEIAETDLYGDSLIDVIGRGARLTIDAVFKVYTLAGTVAALAPWVAGSLGRVYAAASPIGQLGTSLNTSLVLTAVAGTSAAATPATLTCSKVVLSEKTQQLKYTSEEREVPLEWDALTTDSAGTGSFATST